MTSTDSLASRSRKNGGANDELQELPKSKIDAIAHGPQAHTAGCVPSQRQDGQGGAQGRTAGTEIAGTRRTGRGIALKRLVLRLKV